jgi:hypothetical protein
MKKLSVLTWLGNAAAVLCGRWGAVTAQTQEAGCSRQAAYDHAQRVHQAVTDAQSEGSPRAELLRQLDQLRQENRQLWQELQHAIDFPPAKQQHFAALAAALGLSLNQTQSLLAILLPPQERPSRATLGRWVEAAAGQAGRVLPKLDEACQTLVSELCLDEIFCHRQPVLVGVEPHSMAWVVGQRAANCSGDTWQQALQPWQYLESVVADAGSGLQKGLHKLQQQRLDTVGSRPFESGLDLFHIKQEGQRVLRLLWSPVEQAWLKAEQADRTLAAKRWHGDKLPAQHAAHVAGRAWRKVAKVFGAYEQQEAAWRRLEAAFELYRPDGQLNDRTWAQGEIAQAKLVLCGAVWSKVRRFVNDPRCLTFLDRLTRDLAKVERRPKVRAALVELWRLRHGGPRGRGPQLGGVCGKVKPLVQAVVCQGLAKNWRESYRRVSRVLSRVVRASSVVECMNSVVRMHQARHRTLSQQLLDLKRLHWNCRRFKEGKRHGACPYQHLGLALPTYDWWQILQTEPDELRQTAHAELPKKVSTQKVAA